MIKPLSPETIVYGFTSAGDADISPDGTRITYSLGRTDRETKKGGSQIWLCDIDGANKRQLTSKLRAARREFTLIRFHSTVWRCRTSRWLCSQKNSSIIGRGPARRLKN